MNLKDIDAATDVDRARRTSDDQNYMIRFIVILIVANIAMPCLVAQYPSITRNSLVYTESALVSAQIQFVAFWMVYSDTTHIFVRIALAVFSIAIGNYTIGVGDALATGRQLQPSSTRCLELAIFIAPFYFFVFFMVRFRSRLPRFKRPKTESRAISLESLMGVVGLFGLSAFLLRTIDLTSFSLSHLCSTTGNYHYVENDIRLLLPNILAGLIGPIVILTAAGRAWTFPFLWCSASAAVAYVVSSESGALYFGRAYLLNCPPLLFFWILIRLIFGGCPNRLLPAFLISYFWPSCE
ncbi:MAG: hypothetical protein R3C28_33150 [Pirellulaceae bacterium]